MVRLVDQDDIPCCLCKSLADIDAERTYKELGVEQLLGEVFALDVNRPLFIGVRSHDA